MTWKEFKDAVEKQGITDRTEVDFIDWSCGFEPKVLEGYGESSIGIY